MGVGAAIGAAEGWQERFASAGVTEPREAAKETQLSGIFVSYRRSDSQGEAGRLFDDLVHHFDESTVFMDVSAIEAGRDFRKAPEEGVTKCGVLLVMIGPQWVGAKDEQGARRLDDAADFVRIETASALRRDIPVIPVLVRGARMPSADQLPDDLKELAYRNCIELTHARWRSDIQLLIEALRRIAGVARPVEPSAVEPRGTALQPPTHSARLGKLAGENSTAINPALAERVSRELAHYIGPIAAIVVKRAAANCASVDDLYQKVAEEIDSRVEREKFLTHADISSPVPSGASRAETPAKEGAIVATALSTEADSAPGISSPKIVRPPSSGLKYVLLAGGALVLIAIAVFAYVMSSKVSSKKETPARSDAVRQDTVRQDMDATEPNRGQKKVSEGQIEEQWIQQRPIKDHRIDQRDEDKPVPAKADVPTKLGEATSRRVRVSQDVLQGWLIREVKPDYPPLARQAHVQGMVIFDVDISKQGAVQRLRAVSGHPLLIPAAIEAVKQWQYRPYVLNGTPAEISTRLAVNFTLR